MNLVTAIVLAQLAAAPTLSFGDYYRQVLDHHPVARQARLLDTLALANEWAARGAFDPKLVAAVDRKRFGAQSYYDYLDASLTIPTRLGVDLTVGYERTRGLYPATDRRTPGAGLLSAGVSLPLGQRLLIDDRRAAVQQARALRDYASGERINIVNKLLATATAAYAGWWEAWQRAQLADDMARIADVRLRALRQRVQQGDAAAIDTLEAALEWQRRRVQGREAALSRRNAAILVEGMRWDVDGEPTSWPEDMTPVAPASYRTPVDSLTRAGWIEAAMRRHPEIGQAVARVRGEELSRAVAFQRVVVPNVAVTLAGLSTAAGPLTDALKARERSDHKVGLSGEFALWLRKERGQLMAAEVRLEQAEWERALVRRRVDMAVEMAVNELRTLEEILGLQATTIAQARRLRDGEQAKFDAGESTLFLVTARERQVIEEEIKRIAWDAKWLEAIGRLSVAVGAPILP